MACEGCEKAIDEIKDSMKELAEGMKKLVEIQTIQQEQSKALDIAVKYDAQHFKDHEDLTASINKELPTLILSKQMVFYGTGFVLTAVLTALVGLVIVGV